MSALYALYLNTLVQARSALAASDDARLLRICGEVAGRAGAESTVSLLALSDAEHGRTPRPRSAVLWTVRNDS